MRARWTEERAAGATGETFARWRFRVRAEVLGELRKVFDGDRRRWTDPRKRDLVCRNGASARGRKGLRLSQRNLLAQWISLARLTRQLASQATAQPSDLSRR
jgi:hypothetical protein